MTAKLFGQIGRRLLASSKKKEYVSYKQIKTKKCLYCHTKKDLYEIPILKDIYFRNVLLCINCMRIIKVARHIKIDI